MALDPQDRKLLSIAGAVFLLLLCAVAFLTPATGENAAGVPSTYSSSPGGARAAFLLLQELHLPVERWENPPMELPDIPGAVLILADPDGTPNQKERGALEGFVRAGGTVLFTGPLAGEFFSGAETLPPFPVPPPSFPADLPSPFTRGAPTIALHAEALWGALSRSQLPLYGNPQHPAVVIWPLGAGRVLWWAGPDPLTNAGIAKESNLNFFLDAVGADAPADGAAGRPPIFWDEYYHGERSSLWAYTNNTPVPWALVQFAVLAAAVFFTFARRSGPVVPAFVEPRLWPLEFVDTLGSLYQHAGAASAAVLVVYRNFRATLAHRMQIPLTDSDEAVAHALEQRLGGKKADLAQTLREAGAGGRAGTLKPAAALALIQQLEVHEEKLGLRKPGKQGRPATWNISRA